MWTRRKNFVAKGVIALLIAGVIMAIFIPLLRGVYEREVHDQGARLLVIVATDGGTADYEMHARARIDVDGNYRVTFYVDTAKPETVVAESRFYVDFEVTVAGAGAEGAVRCGDSAVAQPVTYDALSPGAKYVFDVDQASTRSSATNFDSGEREEAPEGDGGATPAPPSPTATTAPQQGDGIDLVRYSNRLATWFDTESPWTVRGVSGEATYVEECTIDRHLIWAGTPAGTDPTELPMATLLPPQINYTSIGAETTYQADFDAWLWVDRGEGATLAEGFPSPQAAADGWSLWYQNTWRGERGSSQNFSYTDQPTLLFANRGAARGEQTLLIFGGMALGLALTLIVRGLSDLADAIVTEPAREPKPDEQPEA